MVTNNSKILLLGEFNKNWTLFKRSLCVSFDSEGECQFKGHLLEGEISRLFAGKWCSLPFFTSTCIIWCTLGPDDEAINEAVNQLEFWILPSYGWLGRGDGYQQANPLENSFQKNLAIVSPTNYYKWRSSKESLPLVVNKLRQRHLLKSKQPQRSRQNRPSLYELRSKFHTALVLGDREVAQEAIDGIDLYELDKALNTQMMRIRMWHHFHEYENIKKYPHLPFLKSYPSLPTVIINCLNDALLERDSCEKDVSSIEVDIKDDRQWSYWFDLVRNGKFKESREWLDLKEQSTLYEMPKEYIDLFSDSWDNFYLNPELKSSHRHLLTEAMVRFLDDFVRESNFPRVGFEDLYLSLFRLWGDLNAGKGSGKEEGHILLELACALLKLNHKVDEVREVVESWWQSRPVPAQLPYALDAIELLSFHHPDQGAAGNLWIDAVDKARQHEGVLTESEKLLWRETGMRLGLDEESISAFFSPLENIQFEDPIARLGLKRVAIVCMRPEQARVAAKEIESRSGAEVVIVSERVAGSQVNLALKSNVVLFVWLATTHAVFRAFDGYARQCLCYVQGTGGASIVRSLERWAVEQ